MKYKVGDIIEYRTFGGELRKVKVEIKEEDVKNGRPGFDGTIIDMANKDNKILQDSVWGYDSQITRVIKSS